MQEVFDYLIKKVGLRDKDSVVVGVSGGPDSMALLNILLELKKEVDIKIICAHVNHNVRKESNSEEEFIRNYCNINSVEFELLTIESYGDDNFHNEARTKRYNFFEGLTKKYNSKYLFTAHHGDDLIETILMRITRGSSLKGYSGFQKEFEINGYKLIRPLISYTKEDILAYNKENKVKFVTDLSNEKETYTRNRYRKYILPFLKKEDPNVHSKFYKFSNTLLEYNSYVEKQARKEMKSVFVQQTINIILFLKLEEIIQKKIISLILESIYNDDLILITDIHVDLIIKLIESDKANTYIHLPNDISVIKSYNTVVFKKEKTNIQNFEIELSKYVNLPNGKNLEIINETAINSNFVCRLNSKEVKLPLYVRNRRNGDKIKVKGMLGSKKINDIFTDEKISKEDRDLWPIVLDSSNTVVWIPGLKKSIFDKEKKENYDIIIKYY